MVKKVSLFLSGVVISGFGVALSTQAGLGATPISSVPWVFTFFCPLSYGTLTLLVNILLVLAQILILRRRFEVFQLMQIPITALFGACIDIGMWITRPLVTTIWLLQVLMLIVGAAVLAFGIVCRVRSDFLCIPGDALVKVINREFGFPLSKIKVALDGSLVSAALLISFFAMGRIEGVREGTLMSVFLVGGFIGLITHGIRNSAKTA